MEAPPTSTPWHCKGFYITLESTWELAEACLGVFAAQLTGGEPWLKLDMRQETDQRSDDHETASDQRALQESETILEAFEAPVNLLEALVDAPGEVVDLLPESVEPGVCRTGVHGVLYCCIVNIAASPGVVCMDGIARRHRRTKAAADNLSPLSLASGVEIHGLCDAVRNGSGARGSYDICL